MSGTVAFNEVVRARIYCQDVEQGSINTFAYKCVGVAGGGVTYADFGIALDVLAEPVYKAIMYNLASYRGVGVQSYSALVKEVETVSNSRAGVGTAGAVGLPRQACGLASWTTGVIGPKQRGRTYLPFPAAADNMVNGVPTGGYNGRANAVVGALLGPVNVAAAVGGGTAVFLLGVWNRAAGVWSGFSTGITNGLWASQRRRGSYGRPNVQRF